MRAITKFVAVAAAAASLTAFAAPAQSAVYIGLQQAGVNGGLIDEVANGTSFATFNGAFGSYEFNLLTGVDAFDPVLLDTTLSVHSATGTEAGTLDVWFTLTDISGPVPGSFFNSYTVNTLPPGWGLTVTTYVDIGNGTFGGTQIYTDNLTAAGVSSGLGDILNGLQGPYSVTQRFTITTPAGPLGCENAADPACATDVLGTGRIVAGAIPEPGTWALMILGFGGAGAVLRSRRRHGVAFA